MGVMRKESRESGDGGVNLSQKIRRGRSGANNSPGQLAEYQKGPQQGHNQNFLWELPGDPGELMADVDPNPTQQDELKGRILKNDGNVRSSCWIAGGN